MDKVNVGIEASSWINIVAGIALVAIAWYDAAELTTTFYAALVAGLALVLAGAWTAWDAARNEGRHSAWVAAVSILVGAAIFAYPWLVNVSNLAFWSALSVGAAVMLVSAFETYAAFGSRSTGSMKGRIA